MRPTLIFLAAAAASALALAGCGRGEPAKPRAQATPPAVPAAPSLWRIQAINDGKVVKTLDICADRSVQDSFSRPTPELNGQPCERARGPVEAGGGYVVLCRMNHENYMVNAVRSGDPDRDFTVQMTIARQTASGPTFEQTRRYTRVGDCPAGWEVGTAAAPGDKQTAATLPPAGRKAQ